MVAKPSSKQVPSLANERTKIYVCTLGKYQIVNRPDGQCVYEGVLWVMAGANLGNVTILKDLKTYVFLMKPLHKKLYNSQKVKKRNIFIVLLNFKKYVTQYITLPKLDSVLIDSYV